MPKDTTGLKRGGSRGRPKGVPNKVTIEAREAATQLIDNPHYRERLEADLVARKQHPSIEQMLWYYAKGKPVDRVEQGEPGTFAHKSEAELRAYLVEMLAQQ
jgi:hypothetical protein